MAIPAQQIHKYYEFIFSNDSLEDENEDGVVSSASDFYVDCEISLFPLTFMRSTNAECALKLFHVNSSPLSLIENQLVEVHVNTPLDSLPSNHKFHALEVGKINKKPFLLHTDNFSANGSKDATLQSINKLLSTRVNLYLLWRMAGNSFDIDVFKEGLFENVRKHTELSLCSDEIRLLSAYCDITSYTRRRYLEILGDYITPIEIPPMRSSSLYAPLAPDQEGKILDKSTILKSSTEIGNVLRKMATPPMIHFTIFYGVDLSQPNAARDSLDNLLSTHYIKILKVMQINLNSLDEDDKTLLSQIQQSHLTLLKHANCVNALLTLEQARLSHENRECLFQLDFLQLEQNAGRVSFSINNHVLPDDSTTVKIILPESISYVCGTKSRQDRITVGEVSYRTKTQETRPKFTNAIVTSRGDRLYTPIKNHPNLIYVCTDLLSESSIYKTLPRQSKFPHYNVLHVERVNEETLTSNTIYKCPTDLVYHRILRSFNHLNRVRLLLLDEYWEKIYFPYPTKVTASLRFQSTSTDD